MTFRAGCPLDSAQSKSRKPQRVKRLFWEARISDVPEAISAALVELGLADPDSRITGAPITGGVSSDIWRIDLPGGPVCAKRALSKLRVAKEWFASPHRIAKEAAFNAYLTGICPGHVPQKLGFDAVRGVLVSEFLPPADYPVWKALLAAGRAGEEAAAGVANVLLSAQLDSLNDTDLRSAFEERALIFDLRLQPYLLATASAHEDLSGRIASLVDLFDANAISIIHGDFSPKNILIGPSGPVILDAECANWGDPAFDIAFCLNHFLLKAAWKPEYASLYSGAFAAFTNVFDANERAAPWLERAALYLPALLLARIDGKSPVEYATNDSLKDAIRGFARQLIAGQWTPLLAIASAWFEDDKPFLAGERTNP